MYFFPTFYSPLCLVGVCNLLPVKVPLNVSYDYAVMYRQLPGAHCGDVDKQAIATTPV
jgi:hypothetical protein